MFRGGGWQLGGRGLGVIARAEEVCRSALGRKYVQWAWPWQEEGGKGEAVGVVLRGQCVCSVQYCCGSIGRGHPPASSPDSTQQRVRSSVGGRLAQGEPALRQSSQEVDRRRRSSEVTFTPSPASRRTSPVPAAQQMA